MLLRHGRRPGAHEAAPDLGGDDHDPTDRGRGKRCEHARRGAPDRAGDDAGERPREREEEQTGEEFDRGCDIRLIAGLAKSDEVPTPR